MEYIKQKDALHILDLVIEDKTITHKYKAIRKRLKGLPTEDVEKVVRCKDCTNWQRHTGMVVSPNGFCFYHEIQSNGYDFCSYGERKEGAEE